MRVLLGRLTVAALLSTGLVAQSPSPTPSFGIADVHVRPHSSNATPQMTGGVLRGGRYDIRNATMLNLISLAYAVDGQTVLGGPNWLDRNRFDIIAKAPDGTPRETLQLMLQSLLADRFKLVLHKDTKPVPSYILTVSGTPRLKPGTAPADDDAKKQPCQSPQTAPPQTSTGVPFIVLSCHGITMETFAQQLQGFGGAYIMTRVVDQTGLTGYWDFDLKWTGRGALARAGSEGITIPAALEQLGLKITYDKAPAPVLVVDSVNDTPTPNPSGTAENLPAPPPAEFDVADIKVAAPDTQMNGRLQPNGRLDFQGATMKTFFDIAWDINDDDLLAGAPKWFDTTKYSLVAKVSSISSDPNGGVQIDIDDIRAMLRALLIERFKIVTHVEQRPVDAYTLIVADKPKLQAADPSNRTKWFNGVLPGVKDPRETNPALNRLITVQNMTMAQFAEDLSSMAPGYLREPVVDGTGIDGAFDFVLSFSAVGVAKNNGPGGDASGALAASAPTGALSLLDALQKELGLKLDQRKRPLPVLVIDHIEEQPTDR
jgi:uncharacterized protein (TIGR03435 family)